MTDSLQIMDAVSGLAAEGIPELERIYIDLVPTDFLRPSLLIQPVTQTRESAAVNLVRVTEYFTLTVFDTTDDYSQSDTRNLLELQQKLLNLFRSGRIAVGDRNIAVTASTGGRDWDKAFVDLQAEYLDLRDETPDAAPKMESIETNLNLKG